VIDYLFFLKESRKHFFSERFGLVRERENLKNSLADIVSSFAQHYFTQ
jgi:hypothetical protein